MRLLAEPQCKILIELRDTAMLENCCMPPACVLLELVSLQIHQLASNMAYVRVTGKGNKDRLVPTGEEAQY